MPHDRVALDSVDVNHCDRDLLARWWPSLELAGVRSNEAASRDAVRTGDKELLDLVTAVRKAEIDLLQVRPPFLQPHRGRTTDLDHYPRRHQRVECGRVLVVDRPVQALDQFSDRIVRRISHELNVS